MTDIEISEKFSGWPSIYSKAEELTFDCNPGAGGKEPTPWIRHDWSPLPPSKSFF
jgi:hypothetical protein